MALDLAAYSSHQKSAVWKYFGVEKNSSWAAETNEQTWDKRVTCKLCAQKVAHGGGAINLKDHLRTNHHKEFDKLFENDLLNPLQLWIVLFNRQVWKSYHRIRHKHSNLPMLL